MRPAIEERIERAAAYLGIAGGFDGFCAFVDELIGALGIPTTLTRLGVKDPDIDRLTAMALEDPSTGGNPIKMTPENTSELIAACL
jgi:alcohol dehydrogenase class IV